MCVQRPHLRCHARTCRQTGSTLAPSRCGCVCSMPARVPPLAQPRSSEHLMPCMQLLLAPGWFMTHVPAESALSQRSPLAPSPCALPGIIIHPSEQGCSQAYFGACDRPYMLQGQFCAASCGRCSSYIPAPPPPGSIYCADLEPAGDYTCLQQAFVFNKCDADFIVQGLLPPPWRLRASLCRLSSTKHRQHVALAIVAWPV